MKTTRLSGLAALAAGLTAAAQASAVIDGQLDVAFYGAPLAIQTTQTQFGDSNLGQQFFANGSELDGIYAKISGGRLYILLTGNLESNFNKLELFLDTRAGGQNRLRGDNSGVSFNGLNRMGDDGSGNGFKFDAGFSADYWFSITGGDIGGGTYGAFVDAAELLDLGGGPGEFLGGVSDFATGTLGGGNNIYNVLASINNSNTLGVDGGTGAASGAGVTTGMEFSIDLAAIGNPTGPIKLMAFVNGGGHDFSSNQYMPSLPVGTGNLGEPRAIDLTTIAGDQYVSVSSAQRFNPISLSVIGGQILAGSIASLVSSDNNRLIVINDENDAAADMRIGFLTGLSSTSSIAVQAEVISVRDDQSVFLRAKNFTTNADDDVAFGISTLSDSILSGTVPNAASQYLGSGGAVEVGLTFIPSQDLDSGDGWSSSVDEVFITVQ